MKLLIFISLIFAVFEAEAQGIWKCEQRSKAVFTNRAVGSSDTKCTRVDLRKTSFNKLPFVAQRVSRAQLKLSKGLREKSAAKPTAELTVAFNYKPIAAQPSSLVEDCLIWGSVEGEPHRLVILAISRGTLRVDRFQLEIEGSREIGSGDIGGRDLGGGGKLAWKYRLKGRCRLPQVEVVYKK